MEGSPVGVVVVACVTSKLEVVGRISPVLDGEDEKGVVDMDDTPSVLEVDMARSLVVGSAA